jgi:hypothetical protein
VYRAAIGAIGLESPGAGRRYGVAAQTTDPSPVWRHYDADTLRAFPYLDPRHRLSYARPDTVSAFLAGVARTAPVPLDLEGLGPFLLVAESELVSPAARDWSDLAGRKSLANGVLRLSPIGYSDARAQALVYVQFECGTLCGSGAFVLLERRGSGWRPVKVDVYIES